MAENGYNGVDVMVAEELVNEINEELSQHPAILALLETDHSFVLTDPKQAGNPIVYASQAFLNLTGYPVNRVLGRNCRFLQGPGTDPSTVAKIRQAVDNGEGVGVRLLNYRRDGSTFWNQLIISAIYDSSDTVINFVGIQCLITEATPE